MPAPLRGLGITFIITGLMAIGFMSFGGMLTGGDEEEKSDTNELSVKPVEDSNELTLQATALEDKLTQVNQ
ncbi:Na(+)-translocating NADH-quinone reductase subunit E [Nonlabens ulvanivorans]|nr:Na(+)-translocating NADH-quinone reductase subunit E [Nonlabens ulvanivorans]